MAVREKSGDLPVRRDGLQVELLVLLEVHEGEVPADLAEAPLNGLADLGHDAVVRGLVRQQHGALYGTCTYGLPCV